MKQYFLVIYSRVGEAQKNALRRYFDNIREIFPNCFACELENDLDPSCEEVRTELLNNNDTHLMVIRLDADFSSAWYLRKEANEYLTSIFKSIHHDTK